MSSPGGPASSDLPPPPSGVPSGGPPPRGLPFAVSPPPPLRSSALPYRSQIGFAQVQRTAEEIGAEKRRDRLAKRRLAASPELMAVSVTFLLIFGLSVRFDPVILILGSSVYGIFGWLFLANGDAIMASLALGALGLSTIVLLSGRREVEENSLWWMLPALVVVGAEAAITYNHFRRRESDISRRISQLVVVNLVAVVAVSLVLASVIRRFTELDGRVEWPWYAATIILLAAGWFVSLIVLRRTATPAERRRYSPGQRMLPPPR